MGDGIPNKSKYDHCWQIRFYSKMLCTAAINTSNTIIEHRPVPAERHSSGLDSNSCYYVFNYSIQLFNFFSELSVSLSVKYVTRQRLLHRSAKAKRCVKRASAEVQRHAAAAALPAPLHPTLDRRPTGRPQTRSSRCEFFKKRVRRPSVHRQTDSRGMTSYCWRL